MGLHPPALLHVFWCCNPITRTASPDPACTVANELIPDGDVNERLL